MKLKVAAPVGRFALASILTGLLVVSMPQSVLAHARLLRADPKEDSQLAESPPKVELWFNELLDDGFNSILVYPAAEVDSQHHKNLADAEPQVDAQDRTHLFTGLKPLRDGDYIVQWTVLSLDGHTAGGRFKFRLRSSK